MEQQPSEVTLRRQFGRDRGENFSLPYGVADCAAPPVSKRRLRSGPNSQPGDTHHCADGLFARDKHLVHESANACSLVLFLARPRAGAAGVETCMEQTLTGCTSRATTSTVPCASARRAPMRKLSWETGATKATTSYSPELRERAVRLVLDHQHERRSQWAAIFSVPAKVVHTPSNVPVAGSHLRTMENPNPRVRPTRRLRYGQMPFARRENFCDADFLGAACPRRTA